MVFDCYVDKWKAKAYEIFSISLEEKRSWGPFGVVLALGSRSRIDQKIDQTSTKNQSKINQNLIKNQPKIVLGRVLGGPWSLLAAEIEKMRTASQLLGPLGAILGPSWGPLEAVLALGSPS